MEQFETILILQSGGLGDLVLLADFVGSLRNAYPSAKITLACRSAFQSLPGLYPRPPDEVLPIEVNPYLWSVPSEELTGKLRPLVETLRSTSTDLFIAAEHQLTWLSWFAASAAQPKVATGCKKAQKPGGLLTCVLDEFGLEDRDLEGPVPEKLLHERERYQGILGFLGVEPLEFAPWRLPENARRALEERLLEWNLQPGGYLVCFPLSLPAVRRWPLEQFGKVLRQVRKEFALPVLLTGDSQEEAELNALARGLPPDPEPVRIFAGEPGQLALLAGLLWNARAYLGSDTGPAHLAQAGDVPGVAVHGGATWPSYGPWRPGSVAIVHALPCFGCLCDCLLGHGLCMESISSAPVAEAMSRVLQSPPSSAEIRSLDTVSTEVRKLIADAAIRYTEAQRDRHKRLEVIVECEMRIRKLERTCQERLEALEAIGTANLKAGSSSST